MNKTWRPKGWWRNWYTPQPKKKIFTEADVLSQAVDAAFEAGASAMLEALKKEGEHIDANAAPLGYVMQQIGTVPRSFKGWFIIIPDEVE